jgi:hypothetical protein
MSEIDIFEGDEVFWNDPEGLTSGFYMVITMNNPEIVLLRNESGTEVEAFRHEIS